MRYIIFPFLILSLLDCQPVKQPSGRDTFKSFGDGRFQILRYGHISLHLHDSVTQNSIVDRVKYYTTKGDVVYVLAEDGMYTVLNFVTTECHRYKSLADAPVEHKKYLAKLGESWWIEFWKELWWRFQRLEPKPIETYRVKSFPLHFAFSCAKVVSWPAPSA